MDNLKNLISGVWINVKTFMEKLSNLVVNTCDGLNQKHSFSKAKECLDRTRNAYYVMCKCTVRDYITPRNLDKLVKCKDVSVVTQYFDQIRLYDDLYCKLLIIAIEEVYSENAPLALPDGSLPGLK